MRQCDFQRPEGSQKRLEYATYVLLGVTVFLFGATVWTGQVLGDAVVKADAAVKGLATLSSSLQDISSNTKKDADASGNIETKTSNIESNTGSTAKASQDSYKYLLVSGRLDAIWNHLRFYSETGLPALERFCELNDKEKPTILRTWLNYAFYKHDEAERQLYEGNYDEASVAMVSLEFWYKDFVEDYQENAKNLGFDAIVETSY